MPRQQPLGMSSVISRVVCLTAAAGRWTDLRRAAVVATRAIYPRLPKRADAKTAMEDTKTAVESMRQDFAEYMRDLNIERQILVLLYDKE